MQRDNKLCVNMKPADNVMDQHVLLKNKPKSDETRAFLTFSSTGDDIDSRSSITSVEQGVCRSTCGRGAWNFVTIFLAVVVALLATSMLVLELYRSREVVGLRTELDTLRRELENLNHRIVEVELWDQLKAFEAAVYAEEAATDDDDDDDDSDADDDVSDDDDYDLDYDVDEDVTRHEKKQMLHPSDERNKHNVDLSPVERTKREIEASVPVISTSYGVDKKQNNSSTSEGLRLYESLVTSGGKNEPKDLSLDWGSTENPIKSYHRVSPLWSSKSSQHKKYVGVPEQLNEAPAIHRRQRERSQSGATQAPSPIISRVSRVMQTDPKDPHIHHLPPPPPAPLKVHPQHKLPDGEVVVKVYQEHRAPESGLVTGPGEVPKNNRRRRKKLPHKSLPVTQLPRPLAAVHYDGDTSSFLPGRDEHYHGNGKLRHPDGKFMNWTATDWSRHLGMQNFRMQDGEVTVRDSGIYFIYAQIYYVDEHDVNGFRVYVNNNAILHCTTMTVHLSDDQRRPKSNTCHTSSATYLSERDKVSVRDVNGLRFSLFEPAKSFFGLVKLSDVKLK